MSDPQGQGPRRGVSGDGSFDALYRASKPRRIYIEDDDSPTVIHPRRETLWRADDDQLWHEDLAAPTPGATSSRPPEESRFRHSVVYTLISTLVPGLGLVGSRQRSVRIAGALIAGGFVALVVATMVFLVTRVDRDPGESFTAAVASTLVGIASNRASLHILTVLLAAIGLLWVALIAGTHVATRPRRLGRGKRLLGAFLVAVLSMGVAAPVAVGARYSQVLATSVGQTFSPQSEVVAGSLPTISGPDPFEDIPRLNILLLGADMDERRIEQGEKLGYGLRTDTIMAASIDTRTGETAIIQIPRNVQYTPFPEGSDMEKLYPDGFTGEPPADSWFINTIWETTVAQHPQVFRGDTYPGAEALKQGVEGITGLEMHYFVMLNIDGLRELVDAMGGVTVNINERLPMGGSSNNQSATWGWLEPGPNQKLTGNEALWYARSRWSTSDYSRMARQSCLINAIVDQANPTTLLTRFEAIAGASSDMVQTDIPAEALEPLVDLALKTKDQPMKRLVFSQGKNGYWYADPDFEAMRAAVEDLIDPPTASASPSASASASPSPSESPSAEESEGPPPVLVDGSQDVTDACAYNPVE